MQIDIWNVTCLEGKESELVWDWEVLAGDNWAHLHGQHCLWNPPSEELVLPLVWNYQWWVALGWYGRIYCFPTEPPFVGVHQGKWVSYCCLCLQPKQKYTAFFWSLGVVLERSRTRDSIVLLGDFNAVGNDSVAWTGGIGRNGFPNINQSGILLLVFWKPCSVFLRVSLDTLDQRSLLDSVVISCDLWLYVLDMGQRKWLNCQLITIWWWFGGGGLNVTFLTGRKLDRPGVFVVKCLAKPIVWEVFNLNIREHFSPSDSEGGWVGGEVSWSGPCSLLPLSTWQFRAVDTWIMVVATPNQWQQK